MFDVSLEGVLPVEVDFGTEAGMVFKSVLEFVFQLKLYCKGCLGLGAKTVGVNLTVNLDVGICIGNGSGNGGGTGIVSSVVNDDETSPGSWFGNGYGTSFGVCGVTGIATYVGTGLAIICFVSFKLVI